MLGGNKREQVEEGSGSTGELQGMGRALFSALCAEDSPSETQFENSKFKKKIKKKIKLISSL